MIKKSLATHLFDAFYIQRWNDKIRPVELTEMDKHAHKMIIAYCLGKYEEKEGNKINWNDIIQLGIFEFLRRLVISDIKSPIFWAIKSNHQDVYSKLNRWVYSQLETDLKSLPAKFMDDFRKYLNEELEINNTTKNIMDAAHLYASYWEFKIIKQADPAGYEIKDIELRFQKSFEPLLVLHGMKKMLTKQSISNFIDLCGRLRFQIRWSQAPRLPRTSVLGHMFLVSLFSYFFTVELNPCDERLYNNYFGALFHDLPEAVTRDIISPVKRSVDDMDEVIREIEQELVEEEIYKLLEPEWIAEIKYFTVDEFDEKINKDGKLEKVTFDDLSANYNSDKFNPIDGELIKVSDQFAAFLEAFVTMSLGITSKHLKDGRENILRSNKNKKLGPLDIGSLYADFGDV